MTSGTRVHREIMTFPLWDTEAPELPARSRLFKLEPVGIGTDVVESLTSYIARLAAEHCSSPRRLLINEVLVPAGKDTVHNRASGIALAKHLNGIQDITVIVTNTFERLTLRDDLRHMTLLNWRAVLSHNHLLRSNRAWCAFCYEDWLSEGKVIYDPLIWAIEIITVCPKHNEPLYERCPKCTRQLSFFDKHYIPGYCSRCQTWLGAAPHLHPAILRSVEQIELTRQAQIALTVGELLSCSPNIEPIATPDYFIANLADSVAKKARRNINFFADLVGIWSGTIRRLLDWRTKLRLEVLCKLCSRLNASPLDLLLDRGNGAAFQKRHLLLQRDIPMAREITPWEKVEENLRLALEESPPPSIEAVARRMGHHPTKVRNRHPELCQQIFNRYWIYRRDKHPPRKKIISAFKAALKEEPPPSLQRVLKRLGCLDTGYYYYENYEDLCFEISGRYQAYRNKPFDEDKDQRRLKAALDEEPPPSFSEMARRLGHKRDFVRQKFPELSKIITSRYLHYMKVLRKEQAERLQHEIRKAISHLSASGLNASEARVRELVKLNLPRLGRDILFKQALREVKAEFGLT